MITLSGCTGFVVFAILLNKKGPIEPPFGSIYFQDVEAGNGIFNYCLILDMKTVLQTRP